MSKLIVEMEMPKTCPCDLTNGDTPCFAAHGIPKRWADFEKHSKLLHTRPWWCPIIGVLPEQHGRLVDADAMAKDLEYDCELDARGLDDMTIVGYQREHLQFDKDCKQNCMRYLTEQETVVPATERSET